MNNLNQKINQQKKNGRDFSITQKHFLYFLVLGIGSITLVGIYSYYIAKNAILERTFNQLTSVRVEKTKSIQRFLEDRIFEIGIISQSNEISELFNSNILRQQSNLEKLQLFLHNQKYFKRFIIFDLNHNHIQIGLDSTQNILTQYQKEEINKSIIQKIKINKDFTVQDYKVGENQEIFFYVGAPIFGDDSESLLGVLIVEIAINAINQIMLDFSLNSGLGKSGEAYIIGKDYLLRSSSRFKENSIKKVRVETVASISTIKGLSDHGIIKDYRNVDVLSSYAPFTFQELSWGIIAEIDLNEALTPVYNLQNSIIILCIIISIFVFALVYYGSSKLTKPIVDLKNAAIKISNGDYRLVIDNKSNDEIGDLVRAFNEMAKQLLSQSEQIKQDNLLRIQSVIDTQEQERQRLSRDLHDGLGQMLLAIKLKMDQIVIHEDSKHQKHLQEAKELLKNAISEIRVISEDLTPVVLSNFGLEEGIKKLCRDTIQSTNIKMSLVCDNLDKVKLGAKNQIYIYRILQEAINNIIKHSEATKVTIKVVSNYKQLLLHIQDNGKGFDNNSKNFGSGLKNIDERTQMLEGEMELISSVVDGTKINIKIPIKYEKN